MELDLNEFDRLNLRKKELVLIDFKVYMFLGIVEGETDVLYEVLSATGAVTSYSTLLGCVFLKQWLPENEYDFMVSIWNMNSNHKAI
jgi:hypothetical protein